MQPPDRLTDEARCDVCGWPLAKSIAEGCVPGNCSQRPVPTCHICGKPKGQPPGRCNGHYASTTSDPLRLTDEKIRELQDPDRNGPIVVAMAREIEIFRQIEGLEYFRPLKAFVDAIYPGGRLP